MSTNKDINTWRERIGQPEDFPLHVPTDVERAMVEEISDLRAALSSASATVGAVPPALAYPPAMTPTLEHVLGFMNFRTGPIAHVFQAAGFPIPTKCEAEQAFVLDRMIRAVLEHGDTWSEVFTADIKAQYTIIEKKKANASGSAA